MRKAAKIWSIITRYTINRMRRRSARNPLRLLLRGAALSFVPELLVAETEAEVDDGGVVEVEVEAEEEVADAEDGI